MTLTNKEKMISVISNGIAVFSLLQERDELPKNTTIQFHTHDTAGMAISSNMAAIEAGADMIDLAMSPVSGGTSQADILSMWQALRGTDFTLDINEEKILEVESILVLFRSWNSLTLYIIIELAAIDGTQYLIACVKPGFHLGPILVPV